jgi:hypothetical protein
MAGSKNRKKSKTFIGGRKEKPEDAEKESSEDEKDSLDLERERELRPRPLEPPHPWEPEDMLKIQKNYLKRPQSRVEMPSNEPLLLEMRWHLVLEFRVEEALGNMTNALADDIASQLNLTGSSLRRLSKQVEEEGTLLRKAGSGAPPMEETEDMLQLIRDEAQSRKYQFSYRFMAGLVKEEFDKGSASTVWRKLKKDQWRDIRKKTRTYLTAKHIEFRLQWCQERMNLKYEETIGGVYRCDTDEKLFVAMKNGTVLHVPPEVREVVEEVLSKTQPTRLMVLAVIGPPIPSHGFDGKISLVPVMGSKTAKINSKYHKKGDEYDVPITMDGKLFQKFIKQYVVDDIIDVLPKFIKKVILQCDSAGGHGSMPDTVKKLNEFGSKVTKRRWFKFEIEPQPTRSPETNANDLGGWASLDSLVQSVSYHPNPSKPRVEMLKDNILDAWDRWDGFGVLSRLFATKTRVINAIVENEGRNDFPLPRSKKKKTDDD